METILEEKCRLKNEYLAFKEKQKKLIKTLPKLNSGDLVRVIDYVCFADYKLFDGVIVKYNNPLTWSNQYDYTVNVPGIERTQFNRNELELKL